MGDEGKSKRAKSLDDPEDLIFKLPREVIDSIMELLPLGDTARMSVLSHNWRHIWLSTPTLVFDAQFFSCFIKNKQDQSHKFSRIVSKLLYQHRGPIFKFSLYVPPLRHCPDVIEWLHFLSRNGIRDFTLHNHHRSYPSLSSHLFSCVGLEKLKLQRCELDAFSFDGLSKLVSLELVEVTFKKIENFEHLNASFPVLEELNLAHCTGIEHATITIDAPNLKHLVIAGHFVEIKNSDNLLSASFDSRASLIEGIQYKTIFRDLIDTFANSPKLEKLCFNDLFYMLLFKECRISTAIGCLRILELSHFHLFDLDSFHSLVRAIQMCPNIERLDISVHSSTDWDMQMLDYNPDITLHNLRWAKVVVRGASKMELKVIELLLGCSPVLETLSFSFIRPAGKFRELKLLRQLIRLRRASPKVELIGPDDSQSSSEPDSSCESSIDSGSSSESSTDSDSSSESSEYSGFSDDSS